MMVSFWFNTRVSFPSTVLVSNTRTSRRFKLSSRILYALTRWVPYAEMEQKVQNYTSEIERMQAMEAMEAELSKPVNTPITHKPMNGGKDTGDGKSKTGRASDAYKAGMLKALRTNFRETVPSFV